MIAGKLCLGSRGLIRIGFESHLLHEKYQPKIRQKLTPVNYGKVFGK